MNRRAGFTLFELILAIALSATLLALIGTAINLYLLRVDAGRTRVEEAQLARSILATIAADVRSASAYQTQDISAAAELASAAAAAAFDVDDIDSSGEFQGAALGTPGGTGTSNAVGSAGSPSGMSSSDGLAGSENEDTSVLAPGLNGNLQELILDVAQLPRPSEMFPAAAQPSAASAATSALRPSDAKTVRYFVRQGNALDPSDRAATMLAPEAQRNVGGLIRHAIDRAVRQMAEQTGDLALLDSGQVLLAPEVAQVQFRYFDGTSVAEVWDMRERGQMPSAIEVRIWLADELGATPAVGPPESSRMYIQTIDLPLAQSVGASASGGTSSGEQTSDAETGEEFGSSTGFGSEFP